MGLAMRTGSTMRNVWDSRYTIHSYQADAQGDAAVAALCEIMQESAWQHAENLGAGRSHLARQGLSWVLSRQRIVIDALPKWGDTVCLRT